ncbi:MAG: FHA domain-containing protein [bacterium]|nr:FHA domain-containing protein [bacterium]
MAKPEDPGEETTIIIGGVERQRRSGGDKHKGATLHVSSKAPLSSESSRIVPIDRHHFTIGRSSACNLVLDDQKTSRIHAQLVEVGGKHIAEDLGSVNGTFVDGKFIKKAVLESGNVIRIGDTELRYLS